MSHQSPLALSLSDKALNRAYNHFVRNLPKTPPLNQLHLIHDNEQLKFFNDPEVIHLSFLKPPSCKLRES